MITAAVVLVLCVILAMMSFERGWFLPRVKGIPILLYHRITRGTPDNLAVHVDQFERHLAYLTAHGCTTVTLADLIAALDGVRALPQNPVLISFDDGYVDNVQFALPLLRQLQMRATLFIPTAYIGKTNKWDGGSSPLLSVEQLLDPAVSAVFEYGLHGHAHRHYGAMTALEIERDVAECVGVMRSHGVPFAPVLAYPYGGRPKDPAIYEAMIGGFRNAGIVLAMRIGNRVNRLLSCDRFEMKRIDIRGTDSLRTFAIKLSRGRVKMF